MAKEFVPDLNASKFSRDELANLRGIVGDRSVPQEVASLKCQVYFANASIPVSRLWGRRRPCAKVRRKRRSRRMQGAAEEDFRDK